MGYERRRKNWWERKVRVQGRKLLSSPAAAETIGAGSGGARGLGSRSGVWLHDLPYSKLTYVYAGDHMGKREEQALRKFTHVAILLRGQHGGFLWIFFFKKKIGLFRMTCTRQSRLSPHSISKRKKKNGWINGVYKNVIVSPVHCRFPPRPHLSQGLCKKKKRVVIDGILI